MNRVVSYSPDGVSVPQLQFVSHSYAIFDVLWKKKFFFYFIIALYLVPCPYVKLKGQKTVIVQGRVYDHKICNDDNSCAQFVTLGRL